MPVGDLIWSHFFLWYPYFITCGLIWQVFFQYLNASLLKKSLPALFPPRFDFPAWVKLPKWDWFSLKWNKETYSRSPKDSIGCSWLQFFWSTELFQVDMEPASRYSKFAWIGCFQKRKEVLHAVATKFYINFLELENIFGIFFSKISVVRT